VYHPDQLVPNILEAERRAHQRGINLYVSPAYRDILDANRPKTASEYWKAPEFTGGVDPT